MKTLVFVLGMILGTVSFAGGGSTIGPANPASVNCGLLEGKLAIVETPAGQVGMCTIEAWHLFSEMMERGLVKEHHYGPGGMPNPASVNCDDIGGKNIYTETPEGTVGYCLIEEWALFGVINLTK